MLVDRAGIGVPGGGVQERNVAPGSDVVSHGADEPRRKALSAVSRISADGADLRPSGRSHSLPGERDQPPGRIAQAQVQAQFDGAPLEWSGPGARDEIQDLVHVRRAQDLRLRIGRGGERGTVVLDERDLVDDAPAGGERSPHVPQRDGRPGHREAGQCREVRGGRALRVPHETRDVRVVPDHGAVAEAEAGVGAVQRRPDGIVEDMAERGGHARKHSSRRGIRGMVGVAVIPL